MAPFWFFENIVTKDGKSIEILERHEICQGGPETGKLFISGGQVHSGIEFSGPIVEFQGSIILPMRKKTLLFNGFQLVQIDLDTNKINLLKAKGEVVYPVKVDDGVLYFSTSFDEKAEQKSLHLQK